MAVTARVLAKKLNLSEAAISLALNNKPGVSTNTRQRVLRVAGELGYDFSKIKETPKESHTEQGTISFIIYKKHGAIVADTPFFSQLTEGIEQECRRSRYILNVHYFYEDEDVEKQLQSLSFCNGIILLATEMKYEDFRPFNALSVPLVVLDSYFEELQHDCILINNFQGAYQATQYIIRRTKSQPGYLHSAYPIGNFNERADGFFKAIRDNGMSASKSQVLSLSPSMEGAYEDMLALLQSGEKPVRCYFADNDIIAAGAVRALKKYGCRIPEDVSIIGFDNIPLATYMDPNLTTVNVPKQYMGQMAVTRLIQRICSKEHFPIKIEIGTQIITRKSV